VLDVGERQLGGRLGVAALGLEGRGDEGGENHERVERAAGDSLL
jgi:hypothetical protein